MSAALLALLAGAGAPPPAADSAPDPRDQLEDLYRACAPRVHPATLRAVVAVESGGDPLAVNINRGPAGPAPRVRPRTAAEAVRVARAAIARGYTVDLGLMQVNSGNLALLGTTVAAMFEPCANLRAGATILADAYAAAARTLGDGQPALRAALSAYNTGDFARGFRNGYVARYYGRAAARDAAPVIPDLTLAAADAAPAANPYTAPTTVYRREAAALAPSAPLAVQTPGSRTPSRELPPTPTPTLQEVSHVASDPR